MSRLRFPLAISGVHVTTPLPVEITNPDLEARNQL
jgi:hypothetical protein